MVGKQWSVGVGYVGRKDNVPNLRFPPLYGIFITPPGRGAGAAEGAYKVTIVKTSSTAESTFVDPRSSGKELTPDEMKQMMDMASGKGQPKITSLIPKKYTSPKTSGFTAEVTAGGENNFTFEMTQ